jgi:hypothetical protein
MRTTIATTLLALLAGTGVVLGQPGPDKTETARPRLETLPNPNAAPNAMAALPPVEITGPAMGGMPPMGPGAMFTVEGPEQAQGMLGLDVDALLWFGLNRRTPAILADRESVGTLSGLGTADTLNNDPIRGHAAPGMRVAVGYWWTADDPWVPGHKLPLWGVEARVMFLQQRILSLNVDESPTLIRPFYDIDNAKLSGVVVAAPGIASGALSARLSQKLWGTEANFWQNLHYNWPGTTCSIDGMIGIRNLNLDDALQISRVSSFVAKPVDPAFDFLAGNRISESESFAGRNRFIGGQAGLRGSLFFDHLIVSGQFQLGLGDTLQEIDIQGSQLRTLKNGQTVLSPGALLALPSNTGRFYRNQFSYVPELSAKLAFPVTDYLTLGVSFTTLYWSRIVHAADQIDRSIDISQVPSFPGAATAVPLGLARPAVPFNQSSLWLMGAMFTAEVRW